MIALTALYLAIAAGVSGTIWVWDSQPGLKQFTRLQIAIAGMIWPAIVLAMITVHLFDEEDFKR